MRRNGIENGHGVADERIDVAHIGWQDECVVGASELVEGVHVFLGNEERSGAFALLDNQGEGEGNV